MKYEIWQLKDECAAAYEFMDYEWAMEHGFKFEDYEKTYEGKLEDELVINDEEVALELIFKMFNLNRPKDFKGHSLSVSDIVCLNGKKFYCDSWSWKEIQEIGYERRIN